MLRHLARKSPAGRVPGPISCSAVARPSVGGFSIRPTVSSGGPRNSAAGGAIQLVLQQQSTSTSKRYFGGGGESWKHGREHLKPSGGLIDGLAKMGEFFHETPVSELNKCVPPKTTFERGQWWVHGNDLNHNLPEQSAYCHYIDPQYWSRDKQRMYGDMEYMVKMEWLLFWVPSFIIMGLAIPGICGIYAAEDAVDCELVVKVIGRQWYWLYEVESPILTEEDEED